MGNLSFTALLSTLSLLVFHVQVLNLGRDQLDITSESGTCFGKAQVTLVLALGLSSGRKAG